MRERRAGADLVPGGAADEPPRDCRQRPSNSDVFTDAWHQRREASSRVNGRSASHMPSRGRTNASPLFENSEMGDMDTFAQRQGPQMLSSRMAGWPRKEKLPRNGEGRR